MSPEQPTVVLNFGPQAIANDQLRLGAIARVVDARRAGTAPIVVCSPLATPAGGEIMWTERFVDALSQAGIRAVALTRHQIGVLMHAASDSIHVELLRALVEQRIVPVVTGAMPHGSAGHRGGSDVVALLLGRAVGAASVIVYTNSEGVMSADPKRVAGAVPVKQIGYLALMELAQRGASVVSASAAELARANRTRYEIRSLATGRGTAIRDDVRVERLQSLSALTAASGLSLVTVRLPSGGQRRWEEVREDVLERFANHGIAIEMLQFLPSGARFVCSRELLPAVRTQIVLAGARARISERCARVCAIGANVRSSPGIFHRMLRALRGNRVEIVHFADSNVTISVVVDEVDMARAEQALHAEFAIEGRGAQAHGLHFDATTSQVHVRGEVHRLGERQARLLQFLLDNSGQIVEAKNVARAVLGGIGKEELSALRVHIYNLRRKLEEDPEHPRYLVTVPDRGYLLTH